MKVAFTGLPDTTARLSSGFRREDVLCIPLIRPARLPASLKLLRALAKELYRFDAVAFTSKTAVRLALRAAPRLRRFKGRIIALGPGTSSELAKHGILSPLVPETHSSEALVSFVKGVVGYGRVLALCSRHSPLVKDRPQGWTVLPLYTLTLDWRAWARLMALAGTGDCAIVVTSARAAQALLRFPQALRHAKILAISERVGQVLRRGGLAPAWVYQGRDMALFPQALKEALLSGRA